MVINVGELKKVLDGIPDDYVVCSRSANAHLGNDVSFSRKMDRIDILNDKKAIMLVGIGWE